MAKLTMEELKAMRKRAKKAQGNWLTDFDSLTNATKAVDDIPVLLTEIERLTSENSRYRDALIKIVEGEVDSLGDAFRVAKEAIN